jgi:tetratricopeptide (TPR) repeat protein
LDKALKNHLQAYELTPESDHDYPNRLSNISVLYHERFNHLGDLIDLDNAIKYELQAHSLTAENHLDLAEQLSHLGAAYNSRFKHLRNLDDLDKAAEYSLRAIVLTPDHHPAFPGRLNHLSATYYERFIHLGNLSDLDNAIEKRLQAYSLTPKDHPDLATRLGALGAAYHERFVHVKNLDDLQKAIDYKQKALEATPEGHPQRHRRLANIGTSYYEQYMCQSSLSALDKAIECHHQALSFTSEENPFLSIQLSALSTSYHQKYLRLGNVDFLNQALSYLRQASRCVGAAPRNRLDAALDWARLAGGQNVPPDLNNLQAYQAAMELIPEVIWLGITVEQRFTALELLNNVVNKASSAAIQDCCYDLALEWLEQGRCIVWNQILALRSPLDELRVAHPSISHRLQEIRDELQRASLRAFDVQGSVNDPEAFESVVQRHHQLATQHSSLVLQVRQLPGFESFLRPRPAAELVLSARNGPVVVINIHSTSCDALVIRPGDTKVHYLELPYLTAQRVHSMRTRVELSLDQRGPARETQRRPILDFLEPDSPSQQEFKQILVTLWENLVNPILDFLGYITVRCALL